VKIHFSCLDGKAETNIRKTRRQAAQQSSIAQRRFQTQFNTTKAKHRACRKTQMRGAFSA